MGIAIVLGCIRCIILANRALMYLIPSETSNITLGKNNNKGKIAWIIQQLNEVTCQGWGNKTCDSEMKQYNVCVKDMYK